jgi:hypothetical protein
VTTIEGQPSLFLKDLKGKEYPAIAEVKRNKRVNGQRELTLSFLFDDDGINEEFLHDIEFGWKIFFKGEWYTITTPTYALDGDKFSVGVSAVLSFFVDMNGHYLQDEVEDQSMTPANFFRELFEGTGYSYVIVDPLSANTLSYQANQSKTERFLYGVDRFEGEYTIRGKVAYIYALTGSDKNVILHEDLNVQDASVEVDGSGFHTWAKGFGDKDSDEDDYNLEVEYVSPLVEKYGYIEGPAIRDGSYKHADALTEAVKKQVENSYKVSTTITAVDLTNNGYPEMQFEEGDRVFLYVDRLNLNTQVRVVEIEETFDWEGNIIDVSYTLGNEGIAKRYKTQQYNAVSDFRDIQNGRKKIQTSWLDDAIRRASDIINGNLTSHFEYGVGEIIGINTDNPNGYMRFNTDGIGFSRDGGKTYRTAMTYEGIVADAITAGTLRGVVIEGVEIYGTDIFGGRLHSMNNQNTYWNLESGNLNMENAYFSLGGGANIHFDDSGNTITYERYDSTSGFNRTSGIGVGNAFNGRYPVIYMGTSGTGRGSFSANDDVYFNGFIANTNRRVYDDNVGNSVVGDLFDVRDQAYVVEKGYQFDLRSGRSSFSGINAASRDYDLGTPDRLFDRLYIRQVRTVGDFDIRNNAVTGLGWRLSTIQEDGRVSLRGLNMGAYNYELGSSESYNAFFYGYISHLRPGTSSSDDGSGVGSSDRPYRYGHIRSLTVHENFYNNSLRDYKENIRDLPLDIAINFVKNNQVKIFNYKESEEESVGLIRDEIVIDPENESLIGTETAIAPTNIQFMNQLVIKNLLERVEKLEDTENEPTA